MRVLYFDCFSGAAGDMLLGALIDAGVPLESVRDALGTLAIERETVWTERVNRAGVTATKFHVKGDEGTLEHASASAEATADKHAHDRTDAHAHAHSHSHSHVHAPAFAKATAGRPSHHRHRSLREIEQLIDSASLSATGKAKAKELFGKLAEAEAAIHGTSIDKVHLHEVGALDSIIDIVGSVFALESLRIDRYVASPLNVGGGSIRSAHGLYPVPAPATTRLLTGAPIYSGPQQSELVTPTGALLVAGYASAYGPVPAMRLDKVGYGAGSRNFHDSPNVLRVLIGEEEAAAPTHTVIVMEAEIDDMNPQIFGVVMERLLAEGALDVYYTAVQMKKNRPGTLLTVIAPPAARGRLTALLFRETTTIGVRYREMSRECLDRETVTVRTPWGPVRIKVARRDGQVLNAAPEFDDCVRLATESGRPVKEVHAAAMALWAVSSRQ